MLNFIENVTMRKCRNAIVHCVNTDVLEREEKSRFFLVMMQRANLEAATSESKQPESQEMEKEEGSKEAKEACDRGNVEACHPSLDCKTRNECITGIAFHIWSLQPPWPNHALGDVELKIKFREHTLGLQSSSPRSGSARCRLVFDAERNRIKVDIRKNAFTFIPVLVNCATMELNKLIDQLQLKGNVYEIFRTITKAVLAREVDRRGDDGVSSSSDSTRDLFRVILNKLDLRIYFTPILRLKLKKRNVLSKMRRKTIEIRADQEGGLKIVKEPRATAGQRELQAALAAIKHWIRSAKFGNEIPIAQKILDVAEGLKSIDDR